MFWLVAPSVVAVSTTALLAAGCAKGRDEVKRPKSSGSNRASNKQRQSGKSTRKPGTSSKSSRRDLNKKAVPGAKSSRSKREGGSSKSGRSKSSKPGVAGAKKAGAPAGAVAKVDKSSKSAKSGSSKRRSEKDKLKNPSQLKKEKSIDGSKKSERSKRSSRSKRSKSRRSSRSKRSASKKELDLQVDKTQEISGEAPLPSSKSKDAALKTAISPVGVSVTKLELAPVDGVAKQEVRIEPSELRWKSTGGIQNVAVYNHSNVRKALKIKCSDNLLYRVNPVHTFIPAGGSVRVDILRQNGTAKVDKIVIIAADAGKDEPNAREVLTRATNSDMMVLPLIATAAN